VEPSCPGYVIAQLIGALGGLSLSFDAVFGNVHHLGATLPGSGYADWQALLVEIVLTAGSGQRGTWEPRRPAQNVGGGSPRWGSEGYHSARRALVGSRERRLDEPRPVIRSSGGERGLQQLLGSTWSGPIAGEHSSRSAARLYTCVAGGGDPTSYAAGSGRLGVDALREGAAAFREAHARTPHPSRHEKPVARRGRVGRPARGERAAELEPRLDGDPPGLGRFCERLVIASVLLRVCSGELDDRVVKAPPAAEVGGDRGAVPRLPRHAPRASVQPHSLPYAANPPGSICSDLCRALPVPEVGDP